MLVTKYQKFSYSEVDSGPRTRTIELPHEGYLESLQTQLLKLKNANLSFNSARALTDEVVDYCIQRIEEGHASRSDKAAKLIELFNEIRYADERFEPENLRRSINFLHDNACLIGEGIVSDIKIPAEYAQSCIGEDFLLALLNLSAAKDLDNRRSEVVELLERYSCYLEKYFQHGQPEHDLLETQENTAKDIMRISGELGIEIPEYLMLARLKVVNGLALRAFNIVSNPLQESSSSVKLLMSEFGSSHYKVPLKPDDPVAYTHDGEAQLLRAKYHGGQMAYLFNTKGYSLVARTVPELLQAASRVIDDNGNPQKKVCGLLEKMQPV